MASLLSVCMLVSFLFFFYFSKSSVYFSFYLPKLYSSHEDVKDKLDVKEEVQMDGKHISTEDKFGSRIGFGNWHSKQGKKCQRITKHSVLLLPIW